MAGVIFLVTIGLVIVRPKGLTEAMAALLGAAAMVVAGLVSAGAAVGDVAGHWNVLLFFVGLTGSAAVAERSGLFEGLAGTAARLAGRAGFWWPSLQSGPLSLPCCRTTPRLWC
jgi:arsenical pump membrane protein